eukprot:6456743-Amphidinium_carterae.1
MTTIVAAVIWDVAHGEGESPGGSTWLPPSPPQVPIVSLEVQKNNRALHWFECKQLFQMVQGSFCSKCKQQHGKFSNCYKMQVPGSDLKRAIGQRIRLCQKDELCCDIAL